MIEVYIPEGVTKVESSKPLYQWDYGRKLVIKGDNLPNACQVHFCDRTCDKTKVRIASPIEDGMEVSIPDDLLENEYPIEAFFYVTEEDKGYTIIQVHIPVIKRKQPEEYTEPIPPAVQTELEVLLANCNDAVTLVETKLDEYKGLLDYNITYEELETLIEEIVKKVLGWDEND